MEKVHRWCVLSVWDTEREEIDQFILEASRHHPTIKFTAEISGKETNFLDTTIFKGERFHKDSILDVNTHFKPTEKFQYTHYTSCHAPGVKKGFTKGEALRLLRTNSSEAKFEENICNFKSHLRVRGYPDYLGPVPERTNNSIPGINVPYFSDNFIPGINSVPERRNSAIQGINLG